MNSEEEDQLLRGARNGNLDVVQQLLQCRTNGEVTFDISCKGRSKSNMGWTPLHLACYFGHKEVVEELLKGGAELNVVNDMGDTPLHRAAFTDRKELVMLLLQHNADSQVVNGAGQTPREVTRDKEIRNMLEAAERTQERKLEEILLRAAREGDTTKVAELLSRPKPPDINCVDQLGNTPLHCAAYRSQKQCALKLLKYGANENIKNKNNQTALDLAQGAEMKQILKNIPSKGLHRTLKPFEGSLLKSSRFFGWKLCWVILDNGVLSWFQNRSDATSGVHRKGCKPLTQATCTVKPSDSSIFSIKCFDDSIHVFKVSSKESPEQTRKKWLSAIEEHSAYSTQYCYQDQISEDEDDVIPESDLKDSLKKAQLCQQKLEKEVSNLVTVMQNFESTKGFSSFRYKALEVSESSKETYAALSVCLALFLKQDMIRNSRLEQEQERNKILSEALETLATEHHELEQSFAKGSSPQSIFSDDEFYDAVSDSDSEHSMSGFETVTSHSFDEETRICSNTTTSVMSGYGNHDGTEPQPNGLRKYRTSLPAPMFSRNDFSIWSILRKCIGMELSKITMPVIFNEPLSFLQRLTEYMEHTYLIHKLNDCSDSVERLQCVAAFAVSAVASQWERTGKPFNPLLGETYELLRDDLGFRLVSEQVSHHPPVSAFHAEGLNSDFVFHGSIYPKLKFWGKSVEAEPKGIITLELLKHNEAYTWTNPTCCVHNIIVGKLWIEQYGNMEIINHKTGDKCVLNFKPCGLFGKELHKVEGYIQDKSKKKLYALYGKWTECLYTVDPATHEAHRKSDKKNSDEKKNSKQAGNTEEPDEMPLPEAESVQVIPGSHLLWRINPRPPNSAQMYNFTNFAMSLNELHKEMESVLPSTDCRLRPDIRAMENGDIDLASEEKKRLEEKQRAARKNRNKSDEDWKPKWFHQGPNPYNGSQDWLYSGGYWDRNYTNLPNIY
ncbi:oxysterol-binding protein-related protein 1 [Protopterus annectens]|uniref:oxysterol-binding protein-related protein 1 n=1 Tax=Protopterus annectens TaxID=7888 RepID=UPI001CF97AB7|nr:oxysterol-binding protein-related protein 1 [Protopterus annectens]